MIIIGLTGSIGMGKSTVAEILRRLSIPVHDADAAVKQATSQGGAGFQVIAKRFPNVINASGEIDRERLAREVFSNPSALANLEAILHPLVKESEDRFIAEHKRLGTKIVALDIPLLFETGAEKRVNFVAVVSAPAFIQRRRVLARKGMTEERFQQIISRQMPDSEKRKRADFVIPTGFGIIITKLALKLMLRSIKKQTEVR